jgi:hypothetical protein
MSRSTDPLAALRRFALGYPEVEEAGACTKAAFRARGKSFLFLGTEERACNLMLKLHDSLPEATSLATDEPERCKVGTSGWVTLTFPLDSPPPRALLERWIDESYRVLAHKQLVAQLSRSDEKKKTIRKRSPAR